MGKTRVALVEKSGPMDSCWTSCATSSRTFTHRWQGRQYKNLNDDLPQGWAVTTMDFAENYLCVQQDQPQSSYFGYSQVTVKPTVSNYSWPNCDEKVTDNVVYLTDAPNHDTNFIDYIIFQDGHHKILVAATGHQRGCEHIYV